MDTDGSFTYSPTALVTFTAPGGHYLGQNYPNPVPAGGATDITYRLNAPANVTLAVYDALGAEVATLVNAAREAGTHHASFSPAGLPAGVYTYELRVEGQALRRTMVLLR
jgi:hypothetical protein